MARHLIRNAKFFCGLNGTGMVSCQFQDGRWQDFPSLPPQVFSAIAIVLSQPGVEYDDISRVFGSPKPRAVDLETTRFVLNDQVLVADHIQPGEDGFQHFQ